MAADEIIYLRIGPGDLDSAAVQDAAALLRDLVAGGAALGWLEPPPTAQVAALLADVAARGPDDAALVLAYTGGAVVGLGYWTRYPRPTHSRNADVQKIAVAPSHHRQGIARAIMTTLIAAAARAGIEILTLDLRGDNHAAMRLYESMAFRSYGRIEGFVAVGDARYAKCCYALHLTRPVG